MDTNLITNTAKNTVTQSAHYTSTSLKLLFSEKQILVYLPLAAGFISLTSALISSLIYKVTSPVGSIVAHRLHNDATTYKAFGLIAAGLSSLYVIIVTSMFVCATSAAVLAKLEGKDPHVISGIIKVFKRFPRVIKFGSASPILKFIALVTYRKKITSLKFYEALGSAATINIPSIAPAIMDKNTNITKTIEETGNQVGAAWKEGLIFKLWLYGITLLLASLAFLPSKISPEWFSNKELSDAIIFIATVTYAQLLFVANGIIGTVYAAVVYHQTGQKSRH